MGFFRVFLGFFRIFSDFGFFRVFFRIFLGVRGFYKLKDLNTEFEKLFTPKQRVGDLKSWKKILKFFGFFTIARLELKAVCLNGMYLKRRRHVINVIFTAAGLFRIRSLR